ncbi:MAG: DUF1456 family protein [Polyangiales bacterium]
MINNDVLRSVRYILDVRDEGLAAIIRLGGAQVSVEQVTAFLANEDAPGYRLCDDRIMSSFLDGLVTHLRGARDSAAPRPVDTTISNNIVLKKLRVAFELKEEDLVTMMAAAGFTVSRPELTALFRAPGHRNYRPCGDQFLRNFLKSLAARERGRPAS